MRHRAAIAKGRTPFVDGGPVRGVRVRVRDSTDANVQALAWLTVCAAALVGVAMGILGSNPSLVLAWLH